MGRPPAFQFYPNDWLASPTVLLMTPAQEGAYIRLLCYCWAEENSSLPDDDNQLAILSRLGEQAFNTSSSVFRKLVVPHPTESGRLTNMRLLNERKRMDDIREQRRAAGVKSGQARAYAAHKSSAPVRARTEQVLNTSTSTSASSSSLKIPESLDTVVFRESWELWLNYRRGMKKPLQVATYQSQLKSFEEMGVTRAVAMIEHTIRMGWQGLREPEAKAGGPMKFDGLRDFAEAHKEDGE